MAKIIFRLDSICPTGFGKVVGVKIEIDDEKWAGGAEVPRECKRQSGEREPRNVKRFKNGREGGKETGN
jgi:hypothetical protein